MFIEAVNNLDALQVIENFANLKRLGLLCAIFDNSAWEAKFGGPTENGTS